MNERQRFEFSAFPESLSLGQAMIANQNIWNQRNEKLLGVSFFKLPKEQTTGIFERVRRRLGNFLTSEHRRTTPLVHYSTKPIVGFGPTEFYYFPAFGSGKPLVIFEEFAVEWLSRDVWGQDALKDNHYLTFAQERAEDYKVSIEGRILAGLLYSLNHNKVAREDVTNIFANYLLANELAPLNRLISYLTEGRKRRYLTCLAVDKLKSNEAKHFKQKGHEGSMRADVVGNAFVPGVIHICGKPPFDITLTHEYLHTLSYGRNVRAGVPIAGYKFSRGIPTLLEYEYGTKNNFPG